MIPFTSVFDDAMTYWGTINDDNIDMNKHENFQVSDNKKNFFT